jgi:type IV pilus assembly protein PilO
LEYERLHAEEITLKQTFEQQQQQAAKRPLYQKQVDNMLQQLHHRMKRLPTQHEMVGVLDNLSKLGVDSGLTFELFAPMSDINHEFSIELPVTIKVLGNYQQLALFVSRVSGMKPMVVWQDFDLKSRTQDKLEMTITASIYQNRPQ